MTTSGKGDDRNPELVDRVAEALWKSACGGAFEKMHPEGFRARPDYVHREYYSDARAAIGAVEEFYKTVPHVVGVHGGREQ